MFPSQDTQEEGTELKYPSAKSSKSYALLNALPAEVGLATIMPSSVVYSRWVIFFSLLFYLSLSFSLSHSLCVMKCGGGGRTELVIV